MASSEGNADRTGVLIAGGGPVGLTLATELGLRGVECLLVERTDGVLRVPRMSGVSSRVMEFCRRWGIADEVRDAVWSRSHPFDFVYVSTMVGEELARVQVPSYEVRQGKLEFSPEGSALCPQIFFDPILAKKARSVPGASFRYDTRLDSFTHDGDGVTAKLLDTQTGAVSTVRADYLVGCDGAGGVVRRSLDIPLDGLGDIATSVNVFYRWPGFEKMHEKGWARFFRFFDEDGCWAEAIAIDGKELWRLSVFHDPDPDLTGHSYLRKMAGCDFDYEIIDVSAWRRRDYLARSYRQGRVFIAGDAAHEMSPTGGSGMHTGMCEAVNLAWKLAAVHHGWGGAMLLDTYEAECRPVARMFVELSTSTFKALTGLPGAAEFGARARTENDMLRAIVIPEQYRAQIIYDDSPICVGDGTPALEGDARIRPTARPGTRAPHCWIGAGRSTMDLFGEGFVLLRFDASKDPAPLADAAAARGVPFKVVDLDNDAAAAIYARSLVLVRPDGHVAWRGGALPDDALALIDRVRGA